MLRIPHLAACIREQVHRVDNHYIGRTVIELAVLRNAVLNIQCGHPGIKAGKRPDGDTPGITGHRLFKVLHFHIGDFTTLETVGVLTNQTSAISIESFFFRPFQLEMENVQG